MAVDEYRPRWSRRRLICWGLGVFSATTIARSSSATASDKPKINQPTTPTPTEFVKRAFEMRDLAIANGDRGYGALIVNATSLQIISQSPSRVITSIDPSAHAEMEAIRDAARRLGRGDLSGHVMYSSARPCPMCEAAAYWANVNVMYFGRSASDAGAPKLCSAH